MLGAPLSFLLGYFLAGWLNERYGWRLTFVLLALPGLAMPAVVWLTLREPRRESMPAQKAIDIGTAPPSLGQVFARLWPCRSFRHLLLFFCVVKLFAYGILQWQPTFFIRSYGLETGVIGTWFTVIYGLGGLAGTYWGGEWATRYAARNEQRQLRIMALAYSFFGLVSACVYVSPNPYLAFALLVVGAIGTSTVTGPLFGTLQTLVPERMRAVSLAIIYLFANLIGMGLGPLLAGALSDALRPAFGEDSLRYALLALCPGYLIGGLYLWAGSKTVITDLRLAQVDGG
jgi:MFS family permease